MKHLAIFCVLISLFSTSIATPVANKNNAVEVVLQKYMHKHAKKEHLSALQVSYRYNDKVIHDLAIGSVAYNNSNRLTSMDLFEWGSLTKVVTAAILLELQANPKYHLNLHQTLQHWFPEKFSHKNINNNSEWPQAWRTVTILDLLHMTSGIPPYINTGLDVLTKKQLNNIMKPEQLVAIAAQFQRNHKRTCTNSGGCFKPASRYFYSNTNYIIAGMIANQAASRASGKPVSFASLMRRFLNRYTDKNAIALYYSDLTQSTRKSMVHTYRNSPRPKIFTAGEDVTQYNLSWLGAAGGIVGNARGIIKIMTALTRLPKQLNPYQQSDSYVNMNPKKALLISNRHQQCTSAKKSPCYGLGVTYINANQRQQAGEAYFYEGEYWGTRALYYWLPLRHVMLAVAVNSAVPPAKDHLFQIFAQLFTTVFDK
ncbi:MAG: serine hydrolase [Coxiellaceae bacterium]|nr:serine hydrolase [Coxiellaceae bacterium]